jgi:hypothetical protein
VEENGTFSFIHLLLLTIFVVSCVSKEKQKEQGSKELISKDAIGIIRRAKFMQSIYLMLVNIS